MSEVNECISGVYKIVNIKNGKVYIGSTINFKEREREHFGDLKRQAHDSRHMQFSYNKYGKENLVFEVLEYVNKIEDINEFKKTLLEREQYWIDKTKCYNNEFGYNTCPIAGSSLGYRHTDETKKKMSLNHADLSGEKNGFYGKKHTEETNRKNSEAHKGKKLSDEHKAKIGSKGETNPSAKLTEKDIIEIKKLLIKNEKLQTIADIFYVTATTICDIKKNRIWGHIKYEDYFNENELQTLSNLEQINGKLSYNQVVEIKEMLQKKVKQKDIAKIFNVHRTTISDIKNGKIYSNIEIEGITNEELKSMKYNTRENNGMYGKHHTEEVRKKISESSSQRKFSDESREKRSKSMINNVHLYAKLSSDNVYEIKKLLLQGVQQKKIAELFNISEGIISAIKNNKIWKQVNLSIEDENKIKENIILKVIKQKKKHLTKNQIEEIHKMLENKVKIKDIAVLYNVNRTTIGKIKNRRFYANIKENGNIKEII